MEAETLGTTRIGAAYRASCLAELDALKPGNVHAYAAGHRMAVADFVTSAEVSTPHLARAGARVGERIRGGMAATLAAVGQNTNLGILLLCAPIARAAEAGGDLETALAQVLDTLDGADAADVYAAIRQANPGGLGTAARHDVTATGPVPALRDAMAEAAARDAIARAYGTGFFDVFTIGLPALAAARAGGSRSPGPPRPCSSRISAGCPIATWRASTAPPAPRPCATRPLPSSTSTSGRAPWSFCWPGTRPGRRTV